MDKVAIFIASGSGIGADAAKHLNSKGYKVGIMSSSEKAIDLAKNLGCVGFKGSNLNTKDIELFIKKIIDHYGKIDILVNSAGHGPKGNILEIKDEEWIKGMEIYFLNVVRASRLVTPIFKKNNGGSIINISSFAVCLLDLSKLAFQGIKCKFSTMDMTVTGIFNLYPIDTGTL